MNIVSSWRNTSSHFELFLYFLFFIIKNGERLGEVLPTVDAPTMAMLLLHSSPVSFYFVCLFTTSLPIRVWCFVFMCVFIDWNLEQDPTSSPRPSPRGLSGTRLPGLRIHGKRKLRWQVDASQRHTCYALVRAFQDRFRNRFSASLPPQVQA